MVICKGLHYKGLHHKTIASVNEGSMTAEAAATQLEQLRQYDWNFFATDNLVEAAEFEGNFNGLKLPETVLKRSFTATPFPPIC